MYLMELSMTPLAKGESVGRYVARSEGCQGGGVHGIDLAGTRDLLTVLVDQKHDLGAGVDTQAVQELLDALELLLVHDQARIRH